MTEKIKKYLDEINYPRLRKFLLIHYEHPTLSWIQCAIKAGYSKRTARAISSENLTKPAVKEFLRLMAEEDLAKSTITHDQAIKILAEIASEAKKNSEKIQAIKTLADLMGWNAPQKIENAGQITVQTFIPDPSPRKKK